MCEKKATLRSSAKGRKKYERIENSRSHSKGNRVFINKERNLIKISIIIYDLSFLLSSATTAVVRFVSYCYSSGNLRFSRPLSEEKLYSVVQPGAHCAPAISPPSHRPIVAKEIYEMKSNNQIIFLCHS